MDNLEDTTLTQLRDLFVQAVDILNAALNERPVGGDMAANGARHRSDWPKVDLSHLSRRKAIQRWLELLPDKRTASPAEIIRGVVAACPGQEVNTATLQQSIYELWREGKIRKEGWGQYGALL